MTAMNELVPRSTTGRVFETTRRVRLGDADRHGRLRLDALARLLQDVGNDDFADAGLDPSSPFVARRTTVVAGSWPGLGERMTFATWCGGTGSHWAERRTSITSDGGGSVEVAALWVNVDETSGRPARLPEWFLSTYGPAAGDRRIRARLGHDEPPSGAERRPWPLRSTDLDVLGHVNNAATWAAVEDECARRGVVPAAAELEYRAAIEPTDEVVLVSSDDRVWLVADGVVRASAVVSSSKGR